MGQRYDLPPLAAARAFEAAARHLSFTRAAAELGMTQAAVSYQIRILEERLGQPVFTRRTRRVELTDAGRLLATGLSDAFQRVSDAYSSARGRAAGMLSVKVHTTFAAHWLAPRVGRFQLRHPDIAVRLMTSMTDPDFATEEIDAGFMWDRDPFPRDLVAHKVMDSRFTPMLSREMAERIGGPARPEDILDHPLADPYDPWWNVWLRAAGVTRERPALPEHPTFEMQLLEARHVLAGTSIGILTPAYFREELASGRLVQPFDLVCDAGAAYWFVYPEGRRNVPKIRAFRDWVLGEVAADTDQAPASFAS
jgi:LysR family transcriptional regulator, glycine cleavage system transcriptional activator